MKIILAALNAKYIHSNLAIRYIKSYSNEGNMEIKEYTINENPMDIAMDLALMKPSIVGFSCYIWNIENTLKVCSILKEIKKDIKIILGGPEVSFIGAELIMNNSFIDYIIRGEGERSFNNLIKLMETGSENFDSIKGLIYKRDEKICEGPEGDIIEDLNEIPFPYKEKLPAKIIYYEASRGCPFNCSYCLSSTLKGVRYLDIERVKEELKFFIDKDVKLVKFVDRTFNANKKYANEIWDFLIRNHKNTRFHFEIAGDILEEDSVEILKHAPKGLFQFEIGVQTTNDEVLKKINRRMDFDRVKNNILKIGEADNIHCHLDLIAGLPDEDIKSFRSSFDMCMEIKPDVLQLGFLKVLKGSPIYNEKNIYGIHNMDYPPYQVLFTKCLSIYEMDELLKLERVFETYYNSGIMKITNSYILSKVASPYDFFKCFCDYLKSLDFFNINFDLKGKFQLLYNYASPIIGDNIKDILIYDFLLTTKKQWIPEFLRNDKGGDSKKLLSIHSKRIQELYGKIDFKKLFCIPLRVKVIPKGSDFLIEEENSLVIFDMDKGDFYYI